MKNILIAVFSLLLVVASDAHPGGGGKAANQKAIREKALPVIAVNGSEIRANGTAVWLGDTLDAWKRALGGTRNCYDAGGNVTFVRHSNGLSLGTDHIDKKRVKFLLLDCHVEPAELAESAPSYPNAPFPGPLNSMAIQSMPKQSFGIFVAK